MADKGSFQTKSSALLAHAHAPHSILLPLFAATIVSTMASSASSLISFQSLPSLAATRISSLNFVSLSNQGRTVQSFRLRLVPDRLCVSCAAKPETVEKVCAIVKKQLALKDDIAVSGESKFEALGADSLDTVEIVMELEEEFGISVEEESAQRIATVEDAAELIDKLVQNRDAVELAGKDA